MLIQEFIKASILAISIGLTGCATPPPSTAPKSDSQRGKSAELGGDYAKAIKFYNKAASNGDKEAMYALGRIFTYGREGVLKDKPKGLRWYQKASENGSYVASYALFKIYENDNWKQANSLLILAGEQSDNVSSSTDLKMFIKSEIATRKFFGHGTTKNESIAIELLKAYADNGNYRAMDSLARKYHKIDKRALLERDDDKALYWYKQAYINTPDRFQNLKQYTLASARP